MTDTLTWEPPGPGSWVLEEAHWPAPVSPAMQELLPPGFSAGVRQTFESIGAPLADLEVRFVNDRLYRRLVPLVGRSMTPRRPPPAPAVWLLARVHPEFRRRNARARAALAERPWRDEFKRWTAELEPEAVAANRRLQAVPVADLTDADLADHIAEAAAHLRACYHLHFELHYPDLAPIGLLLGSLQRWGIDPTAAVEAIAGSSPATTAPARILGRLHELARATDVQTLDDIRALGDEATELLDEWLDERGWHLVTGYDVTARALCELPGRIVSAVRAGPASPPRADTGASRLRQRVPTEHRERFDELLEDARGSVGLRDANGPTLVAWPTGLLRRALLAAGDRLVGMALLASRDDVLLLSVDEATGLLRSGAGPSTSEIAERAERRRVLAGAAAPPVLGPPEVTPSLRALPAAMAEVVGGVSAVFTLLDRDPDAAPLEGTGIGGATYTGTARVLDDHGNGLDGVEPGDVIVTTMTSPAFNSVLVMAGAIVTASGGMLSHAAVMARELGLPAVIGAGTATSAIPDGARVEVDPVNGRVRVLDGQN